jgi:hypothetical protein
MGGVKVGPQKSAAHEFAYNYIHAISVYELCLLVLALNDEKKILQHVWSYSPRMKD